MIVTEIIAIVATLAVLTLVAVRQIVLGGPGMQTVIRVVTPVAAPAILIQGRSKVAQGAGMTPITLVRAFIVSLTGATFGLLPERMAIVRTTTTKVLR